MGARLIPGALPSVLAPDTGRAMRRHSIRLDLSAVDVALHRQAQEALLAGDITGFLSTTDPLRAWELVRANRGALSARSLYERAVIEVLTRCAMNNCHLPEPEIRIALRLLLRNQSRERLRVAYPLPGTGPWELYRGVGGRGAAQRVRGIWWTRELKAARWYAERTGLEKPAVVRAVVPARYVLAYRNEGEEEEFMVLLPRSIRIEWVWP
jgi:hypothetical protein